MVDPPALPDLALLGSALFLFLAGAGCGHGEYLLRLLPGVDGERVRTWTARGALGLATAGGVTAVAASVDHLTACGRLPGEPAACASREVVVGLAAPVAGAPALDLAIRVDGLAALFVAVVGFCAAGIAVYSVGWLRDDPLRQKVAGSFNLFVGAMLLALLVDNVFWLLVALELITLSSADLVRYRGRRGGPAGDSRTAVRTYLMVSHVSLMLLLAGLLPVVVQHASLDFDALRAAGSSPVPGISFALVLLGLAMRAGATPFHFWVPAVHPQLPTNTHAMMSAVLLKLPVYLMIRFFFEGMIGETTWWWGAVLLVLAGVTAVVTVFYALLSQDLKIVLAYHSVENIGIILAGVGLALLFSDDMFRDVPAVQGAGALALLAALYHVVNHALFKTLLFLGTGSIEKRTGTVETAALGGLLRSAPWTAVTFLVGSVAIAGLPPLNGFISEWLTLQALFGGHAVYQERASVALIAMIVLAVTLIALATAFALTALAFVKIVGESLLGEPRRAVPPGRTSWWMRSVLAVLAGACLTLGLQPWLLVPWLSTAVAPARLDLSMLRATPSALTVRLPGGPGVDDAGRYVAELPMLPLLLLGGLPVLVTVLLRARGWWRRPVWVGGRPFQPRTMQYPGSAVAALVWETVGRERAVTGAAPLPDVIRLSPRRGVVELTNRLFNGLVAGLTAGSQRLGDRVQNGDIRSYLFYMLGAVMLVIVVLTVSR